MDTEAAWLWKLSREDYLPHSSRDLTSPHHPWWGSLDCSRSRAGVGDWFFGSSRLTARVLAVTRASGPPAGAPADVSGRAPLCLPGQVPFSIFTATVVYPACLSAAAAVALTTFPNSPSPRVFPSTKFFRGNSHLGSSYIGCEGRRERREMMKLRGKEKARAGGQAPLCRQVTVTMAKGKTPQSSLEVMTRCVLPQEGSCCHRPAGLRMLIPSLFSSTYCRRPGPGISSEGLRVYSAPTGAHRGAQPLPWESGPSLMALACFGHQALQRPRLQDFQENPSSTCGPRCLPALDSSYRWGCQGTFLVWQPLESYHCAPQEPSPHPSLEGSDVEASAPPQPSHCLELAHTSAFPNTPCPLKTPLGWGPLPDPEAGLEDLNSGDAEACLEAALRQHRVPRSPSLTAAGCGSRGCL